MNITDYVSKYAHLSFDENPFNEADSLIMAQMAYLNWDIILPNEGSGNKASILFKNVSDDINVSLNANEFDSKRSEKLFMLMKRSKRYQDTKVRFVIRIDDVEKHIQFFAVTFTLPNGLHVISFRGTDLTLNGWMEDTMLAFKDAIPSHAEAVDYVDKVTGIIRGPFIIVGHSKGGNLSYYSAMMMKPSHRRRLISAYSFDGPGFFSEKIYETKEYKQAKKKLIKYIPFDSVVGILLNHENNAQIISSSAIAFFQHDMFSWVIDNDYKFVRKKKRLITSHVNEKALVHFVNDLTLEEREEICTSAFALVGSPDQSLSYLVKHLPKTTAHFIKTFISYSKEQKKKLICAIFRIMGAYKKSIKYYLFNKKTRASE